MIKYMLAVLLVVCTVTQAGNQSLPLDASACAAQVPFGLPTGKKQDTTVICRSAYILEHDNKAKIPQWVSYVLQPSHATGCEKRSNAFKSDRSLPADKRAEVSDYAKSTYDTGHVANSADMSWNYIVQRESLILSNMTPQLPEFNRGIWKKLEDQTRAWSIHRNHDLLIYAGPIYNQQQDKTIGANMVTVPHGFYKIIVDINTRETLVFKFLHIGATGSLNQFVSSLAQVQKESGIQFPLPPDITYSKVVWESPTHNAGAAKKTVCGLQ